MDSTSAPREVMWHGDMLVDVVLDGTRMGGGTLDVRAAHGAGGRR
jgi:hypothetical protein